MRSAGAAITAGLRVLPQPPPAAPSSSSGSRSCLLFSPIRSSPHLLWCPAKLILLAIAVKTLLSYTHIDDADRPGGETGAATDRAARPDRRARRRQETIHEILQIARDVMTEEGVNGLSLSEVARRLGVQPPSLYKYFPSLMAIFDALFLEGQRANLEAMRVGIQGAEPGLDALARRSRSERAMVPGQSRGRRAALLASGPELPSFAGGVRRQLGDGGAPARRSRRRGGQGPARPRRQRRAAPSTSCRRSSSVCSARPLPTSRTFPGARAGSPRCSRR